MPRTDLPRAALAALACAGALLLSAPVPALAQDVAPASSTAEAAAQEGWVPAEGAFSWVRQDGSVLRSAWVVTGELPGGGTGDLQRYWVGADGLLARGRLVTEPEAGYLAYATPTGAVVRGKWADPSTGLVYLADNDGRLAGPGWVVSDAYGDGLQRYWVDVDARACVPGVSHDGWAHYTTSAGYVLRGKLAVGDLMLLANNDGLLAWGEGWLVTDAYDGGLQRYYLAASEDGLLRGALLGSFTTQDWTSHYGREDTGYVVRGTWTNSQGVTLMANDDGVLSASMAGSSQGTAIMGASRNTADQMVAYFRAQGVAYPAEALGGGGAPDIETFCRILCEEAAAEGVRAEIVFTQAMLETGWLQFGGDVSVEQFNFAGIGATGGGVPGNSFPDVRCGLRAQVQHLKAYASAEPLANPCVDPRFHLVARGSAPTMELLAGKWAASTTYGQSLARILAGLSAY